MIRPTLSALALCAALVCAAPAVAHDRVSREAGVNPAMTAGEAALERRANLSAVQLCGRSPVRELQRTAIVNQCRREILSGAYEMADRAVADNVPVIAAANSFVLDAIR